MMKTVEVLAWFVASWLFCFANSIAAYNYFFGGK